MNHPVFNHNPELTSFLESNFADFNINYIACARLYRDGRFHHIASSPEWAIDHLITNKYPPAGILHFDEIKGKQLTYATENCDKLLGWTEGAYLYAREKYNIKNLLTIIIKKENYLDQYMIDIHNNNAINIYLNYLPIIENIFMSVKHQFNELNANLEKSPFQIDQKFITQRTLIQQINHKIETDFVLCHKDNFIKITRQQHNCLKYLARGARLKSIAQTLNISPRTVETHINHIKSKLGLNTTELIKNYWDNRELSDFQ